MIPSIINREDASAGEIALFDLFEALPEKYYIFHSVAWQERKYGTKRRVIFGEADFLVFVPDRGLISIEVKDGDIGYTREKGWLQINRSTRTEKAINPFEQAKRSMFFFLDVLKKEFNGIAPFPVCSAVWFTSIDGGQLPASLPSECSREIILCSEDMSNETCVEKAIHRVLNYYGAERIKDWEDYLNKVLKSLAPEFQVFSSPKNLISQTERLFHRMTREQSTLLDYLEEQQTATIQGMAGTGKTVLAVEKAKRLSEDGEVLFLCFNTHLKDYLEQSYGQSDITFTNLDTLLVRLSEQPLPVDNQDLKDDMIFEMLLNWDSYRLAYKHFVIDEGQDFTDDHLMAIQEIARRKDGCFYVFYDRYQFVQGREFPEWLQNAECRLILSRNCRNTREVAFTSVKPVNVDDKKLLFLKNKTNLSLSVKPAISFVKDIEDVKNYLRRAIQEKIEQGVALDQIVVLTIGSLENSILKDLEQRIAPNIVLTNTPVQGKVLYTTVRKFKGLEAEAIFLIDVDQQTFNSDTKRRAFYVGASRAKIWLDILIKAENTEEIIGISSSMTGEEASVQRSKINIANWLQVVIK